MPKIHDAFDFHDKRHWWTTGHRAGIPIVKYSFANVSPATYFHVYISATTFSFIELHRLPEYRTNQTCRISRIIRRPSNDSKYGAELKLSSGYELSYTHMYIPSFSTETV